MNKLFWWGLGALGTMIGVSFLVDGSSGAVTKPSAPSVSQQVLALANRIFNAPPPAGSGDDSTQKFANFMDAVDATKLPDGTPILLKRPSAGLPGLMFDARGRWWAFMTGVYVRATPGDGNFIDKAATFVMEKVIPIAVTVGAAMIGGWAGPALVATYAAMIDLANGASISTVGIDAVRAARATSAGGAQASAPFDQGYRAISSASATLASLAAIRNALPMSAQRFFDEGITTGIAQFAQDAAVSALKKNWPAKAGIIDDALTNGAQVYSVAAGIAGADGVRIVDQVVRSAAAKKGIPL